jgi:hypothetical protein
MMARPPSPDPTCPPNQAAAACARIEDLARAAKRAGHPGRVGTLRADLYLGLLDGRWQHLTRDQIIADLLAHPAADSTSEADPATPTGNDHPAGADDPDDPAGADDPAGTGEAAGNGEAAGVHFCA